MCEHDVGPHERHGPIQQSGAAVARGLAEASAEIAQLFVNSAFSHGRYVEALEYDIAAWLDTPHAIAVSSGTAALHLAMLAAGVRPGDEVLVPAHTFIATIWCVLYVGATPVLCDVEVATGTIDVADAARRVTARTTAIVPVHLYGQPADLGAVDVLAKRHGLKVIEDNAQSIGACWDGRMLGTHGLNPAVQLLPRQEPGRCRRRRHGEHRRRCTGGTTAQTAEPRRKRALRPR